MWRVVLLSLTLFSLKKLKDSHAIREKKKSTPMKTPEPNLKIFWILDKKLSSIKCDINGELFNFTNILET